MLLIFTFSMDLVELLNVHIDTKNYNMALYSIFFLLQLDLVQLRVCSSKINFNQQQNNNNLLFHWWIYCQCGLRDSLNSSLTIEYNIIFNKRGSFKKFSLWNCVSPFKKPFIEKLLQSLWNLKNLVCREIITIIKKYYNHSEILRTWFIQKLLQSLWNLKNLVFSNLIMLF